MDVQLACAVLGLHEPFDGGQLKVVYRRLMMQWHPDRHFATPELVEAAVTKTQELNAAYELLTELMEAGWLPVARQDPGPGPRTASRAPQSTYRARHTYQGEDFSPGFPDSAIVEVFLKSSHIISTGYDRVNSLLYIKFTGNRVYRYHGVPAAVFRAFVDAASHGKFAHARIYKVYHFDQC